MTQMNTAVVRVCLGCVNALEFGQLFAMLFASGCSHAVGLWLSGEQPSWLFVARAAPPDLEAASGGARGCRLPPEVGVWAAAAWSATYRFPTVSDCPGDRTQPGRRGDGGRGGDRVMRKRARERAAAADLFWLSCCCWLCLQVSADSTAAWSTPRRPTASFGLCSRPHGQRRYVAFATPSLRLVVSQLLTFSG